jgi:hypothetical protein
VRDEGYGRRKGLRRRVQTATIVIGCDGGYGDGGGARSG